MTGDGAQRGSAVAVDPELAKLRWRCRRGMRELDRILENFLATGFSSLEDSEKLQFAEFLDYPDPDLHAYLVGRAEPANHDIARLVHRIRSAQAAEA